jgi:hypothetical protein
MIEKNHIHNNETRIENATATLRKSEHVGGYSCKACGNPFGAHPPDDVYRFSSVYQCWKFDYQCQKCNNSTTLYWHPKVHKDHDYATLQEIKSKINKDKPRSSARDYLQRMTGY